MHWVWKYLFRLLVLAAVVFVGYAFFADLPPPSETYRLELEAPAAGGGGAASE
ncbi:MAG TPA: hypothetical protein VMM55_04875 [Thermohalobaculum sp.]|nr:hypothetical protein [Thermohalobaculum sp.]